MKLVIELTDYAYEQIKHDYEWERKVWYKPIATGEKLDDFLDKISAEIDEKISHYEHFSSSNTANGLMIAKEIIGKYKGVSE